MERAARVVVVGGGPGGVCAAMLLASRGFQVTLLERQDHLGGRAGSFHLGPYTFDVGSTMLMMRFVLEELFELVDRRLDDHVTLIPLDPMYQLDFGERTLNAYSDPVRMRAELRRFSPGSEAGFDRFLKRERARLELIYPSLQAGEAGPPTLGAPRGWGVPPDPSAALSLYDAAAELFEDEALRQAFSFQSAYLGASPWACPPGFGMVPYVEHAWGIDHVVGGIHQIVEACGRIARDLGVVIHTRAPVERLVVEGGRVTGVELAGGARIPADAVVLSADALRAPGLGPADGGEGQGGDVPPPVAPRRCASYRLFLGLDQHTSLRHHTWLFAQDFRAEMDRVFQGGALSDDLTVYVCNPSRSDPSLAPPGHAALSALVLVPGPGAGIDWATEGPLMRARVLRILRRRGGLDLEGHVVAEAQLTPADTAPSVVDRGQDGPPAGAGAPPVGLRPWGREAPANAYVIGGAAHQGSGLPTLTESARIAARLVCADHGIPFPPSRPLPEATRWGPRWSAPEW